MSGAKKRGATPEGRKGEPETTTAAAPEFLLLIDSLNELRESFRAQQQAQLETLKEIVTNQRVVEERMSAKASQDVRQEQGAFPQIAKTEPTSLGDVGTCTSQAGDSATDKPGQLGMMSQMQMRDILAGVTTKLPSLITLQPKEVRRFAEEFRHYARHVGRSIPIPSVASCMQEFPLTVVCRKQGLSVDEFEACDTDTALDLIFGVFNKTDILSFTQSLSDIPHMKAPLGIETLTAYNEEWTIARKFMGDLVKVSQRTLAFAYMKGLEPRAFRESVRAYGPVSVDDAQTTAAQTLDIVAAVENGVSERMRTSDGGHSRRHRREDGVAFHTISTPNHPERGETKITGQWLQDLVCHGCGKKGHRVRHCPDRGGSTAKTGGATLTSKPFRPRLTSIVSDTAKGDDMPPLIDDESSDDDDSGHEDDVESDGDEAEDDYCDYQTIEVDPLALRAVGVEKGGVFRIPLSPVMRDTGNESAAALALCDSGANCNLVQPSILAEWTRAGAVVETVGLKAIAIQLGGKTATQGTPATQKVLARVVLHLQGYDVRVEEWFVVWEDLNERVVLGLPALRTHHLLTYMETGVPRLVHVAPEEDALDELQAASIRAADIELISELLTESELDDIINNPAIVNQEFPMLDDLKFLLRKYCRLLFSKRDAEGLRVPPVHIELRQGATPPRQPCRFLPLALQPHVRAEIERLTQLRILMPCSTQEAVVCCSPLVITPKADGSLRMAVDYQRVNSVTVPTALTIPHMRDTLPFFRGAKWFAELDFVDGYLQLPITTDSMPLTTIVTPWGMYYYRFLPFGVQQAPGEFWRTISQVILREELHPVREEDRMAAGFVDDITTGAVSDQELLRRLEAVLKKLYLANARLKPLKCRFGFQTAKFIGYILTEHGFHLSEGRKQGILDVGVPRTIREVRGFLGAINFFRDFVPGLSVLAAPLTNLTKVPVQRTASGKVRNNGNTAVTVDGDARRAFESVKEAVRMCGGLWHVTEDGELRLYTDASLLGCGGVLVQIDPATGNENPLAFVSHRFSAAAANWSTIEQECYGVVHTAYSGCHTSSWGDVSS